jgi:hypothetical protein
VFVSGSTLTYTVSSLISTVASNNIHTYINGISVPETFTGSSSNWTVSVPLNGIANQLSVNLAVSVVDNNGLSNGVSANFDTFSQNNLMIEAEDYDFNSGHFIDNPIQTGPNVPATNSYYGFPGNNFANIATYGVDYTTSNTITGETFVYRLDNTAGTEATTDFLRSRFINTGQVPGEAVGMTNTDYDVGWWSPGTWLNYTRTFPANQYVIYGRLASDSPYSGALLDVVTGSRGTVGTFSDANASGFQSWHWVPLMTNGQTAVVTLSGVETLKVTAPPGNATGSMNANYFMFVPYLAPAPAFSLSASASGGVVSIKIPTASGHTYYVYWSASLNPTSWQQLGSAVPGDGTVKTVTDSTTGGGKRFYKAVATTP